MFRGRCAFLAVELILVAVLQALVVPWAYGQPAIRPLPAVEDEHRVGTASLLRHSSPPKIWRLPPVTESESVDAPRAELPFLRVPAVDQDRMSVVPVSEPSPLMAEDVPHPLLIPAGFQPWWQLQVIQPFRPTAQIEQLDVNRLVLDALVYSEQVQALRLQPAIREMAIFEAEAEFDATAFMESRIAKTSEPVGDELTTGGPPRFRESDWNYSAGLRKRGLRGGRLEASQRLGYLDSNSTFLLPTQQGNARLTLSFEQPLLRGAGEVYNTSLIVLAEIDSQVAHSEARRDLQAYLLDVHRAYWELYLQRTAFLQMHRSLERAQAILSALEPRQDFDSTQSQIVIARAAVATRRSELVRSGAAVRNAQAKIAALVNAPLFQENRELELLPLAEPSTDYVPVDLDDALVTALGNRPEVDEALRLLDAARVRLDVSRNELLPALSVVVETYVAGLEGSSRVGGAWTNQFKVGEPGYSAGLVFEVPLYNRAATVRHERRHRELMQLTHRFNALVANLRAEVEVSVREVNTTFGETQSKYAAMTAAEAEVDFMTQRYELLPGDDRAASLLLEDLLTAQERLSAEEFAFADALVSYAVALAELKRVTGVLMQYELMAH